MSEVILCNISDANQILQEKCKEWVYNILELLKIPHEIIYCQNISMFRGGLSECGLHIETRLCGEEVDIYKLEWYDDGKKEGWLPIDKKYLIAQWKRPKYIRRVDGDDVYYELHLNEWSMVRKKE
jgi:hypothetical protein